MRYTGRQASYGALQSLLLAGSSGGKMTLASYQCDVCTYVANGYCIFGDFKSIMQRLTESGTVRWVSKDWNKAPTEVKIYTDEATELTDYQIYVLGKTPKVKEG